MTSTAQDIPLKSLADRGTQDMEDDEGLAAAPRYDRSKAKRHLRGWLSYAFARSVKPSFHCTCISEACFSEVFIVVSVTLFLPICLEQFARDNGVLLPDKTEPCSSLDTLPSELKDGAKTLQCVVKLGWSWVDTASFRSAGRRFRTQLKLTHLQLVCLLIICCISSPHCHISRWDCGRRYVIALVQLRYSHLNLSPPS